MEYVLLIVAPEKSLKCFKDEALIEALLKTSVAFSMCFLVELCG